MSSRARSRVAVALGRCPDALTRTRLRCTSATTQTTWLGRSMAMADDWASVTGRVRRTSAYLDVVTGGGFVDVAEGVTAGRVSTSGRRRTTTTLRT